MPRPSMVFGIQYTILVNFPREMPVDLVLPSHSKAGGGVVDDVGTTFERRWIVLYNIRVGAAGAQQG